MFKSDVLLRTESLFAFVKVLDLNCWGSTDNMTCSETCMLHVHAPIRQTVRCDESDSPDRAVLLIKPLDFVFVCRPVGDGSCSDGLPLSQHVPPPEDAQRQPESQEALHGKLGGRASQ